MPLFLIPDPSSQDDSVDSILSGDQRSVLTTITPQSSVTTQQDFNSLDSMRALLENQSLPDGMYSYHNLLYHENNFKKQLLTIIGWKTEWSDDCLMLYQIHSVATNPTVPFCVTVCCDMSYTIKYHGTPVNRLQCTYLNNLPSHITSGIIINHAQSRYFSNIFTVSEIRLVLDTLSNSRECTGNFDEKFMTIPSIHDGILRDQSSQYNLHTLKIMEKYFSFL